MCRRIYRYPAEFDRHALAGSACFPDKEPPPSAALRRLVDSLLLMGRRPGRITWRNNMLTHVDADTGEITCNVFAKTLNPEVAAVFAEFARESTGPKPDDP